MNVEDIRKLKRQIREAQAEAERAEGALQETLKTIKQEFQCDTIEQAQDLLQNLEEEENRIQQRLDSQLEKFRAKWKDKLDGYDI